MKKKILLTLGSVAAVVTPIATVVACGVNTQTTEPNIEAPTVGGDAEQSKARVGKKYNLITTTGKANHDTLISFIRSHTPKSNKSGWISTSDVDNKVQNNTIYVGGVEYTLSKHGHKDTGESIYIGKDEKLVMVVLTSVADDEIEKLIVSVPSFAEGTKGFENTFGRDTKTYDYDWNEPEKFVPYYTDGGLYIMNMLTDVKDDKGVHHQDLNWSYVSSFGMQDELLSNSSETFKGEFKDVGYEARFLSTWREIGDSAFADNPDVTELSFMALDSIGANAFKDSKLEHLYIKKLDKIGDNAFMSIVNDSSTKVEMPADFDSDEEKDRIFGKDNWDNIQFDFHVVERW